MAKLKAGYGGLVEVDFSNDEIAIRNFNFQTVGGNNQIRHSDILRAVINKLRRAESQLIKEEALNDALAG